MSQIFNSVVSFYVMIENENFYQQYFCSLSYDNKNGQRKYQVFWCDSNRDFNVKFHGLNNLTYGYCSFCKSAKNRLTLSLIVITNCNNI